ncbi:MAG TPA: trigger factor [Pirellulales bacterium]|jgi:trigger factor|nr:trigger factor [Pirellulales bacterium]
MADIETQDSAAPEAPERPRLNLEVKIDAPSACQRHVTVKIPHEDVERYFDEAFGELMPEAQVPGFRAGRAPRKLVEHRFRKEVKDQVKSNLLMDSMSQLSDDQKLAAISEPDVNLAAVEVPDEGPMTFEFNIEVRPDFDLPQWKGLDVERPTREFTDKDVDNQLQRMLTQRGRLVPHAAAAKAGDYVQVNITFQDGDNVISKSEEQSLCIRPTLSFRDGKVEKFDKLMTGAKAGDTKTAQVKLSDNVQNEALRGKTISAVFEVLDVKKLELPELTPAFLEEMGNFKSEDELRKAVREDLQRQLDYHQQQRARQQITQALVASANWELPPELLKRQGRRELERAVLELRRSGFNDDQIRAHENELRQNSMVSTARALKEHFILERIAEEEKIEDQPQDYENEIRLIAAQSGESVRRVRAQLEKRGLMDILRNQIIERKTIEMVLKHAKFKDVPYKPESLETEAIDEAAGGEETEEDIPEAKHAGEAEPLHEPKERV